MSGANRILQLCFNTARQRKALKSPTVLQSYTLILMSQVLDHSLLYLRKPKGSGLFLKPFWLPFLRLGPARVTLRELVYRLVAIVKIQVFGIFFYRYICSRRRNGRFDCCRPDVYFVVCFVYRILELSQLISCRGRVVKAIDSKYSSFLILKAQV